MLAAFLRGLLKPSIKFGMRSRIFEDVILESMSAHIEADRLHINAAIDAAVANVLTEDSKRDALRRIHRQTQRHAALQLMDIYGLADGSSMRGMSGGRLSLLQVFQVMRKEGIIAPDKAPADLKK